MATPVGIDEIRPEDARDRLAETDAPVPIDVRTDRERATSYIPGSVHLPMAEVETRLTEVAQDPNRPVITYCATGARSLRILPTLADSATRTRSRWRAESSPGKRSATRRSRPAPSTRSWRATAATC